MNQKSMLKNISKTFENFGLHVVRPEEEQNLPFGGFIVEFGTDEEDRPVVLQVLQYSHQITKAFSEEPEEKKEQSDLSILTFIMTVPVEVKTECVRETLNLLALTNKAIPLGSFNYSDVEKIVYYSYNIPVFQDPPTEQILLTIIQTLLFVKETFVTVIEDIISGKETVTTFLDLLSEPTSTK